MSGHILACGAGRALMDRRDNPIHRYTLELTGKERPRVLFLGTAAGDDPTYIVSFYETYNSERCLPAHLRLFHITSTDIHKFILDHDVIHVAGGNTANMLEVWRLHGVDVALREAWENGAVMTGGSAGGLCWFEAGTTDSFGPDLQPLADGLGFLQGSFCPHYDAEELRRPVYRALVDEGFPAGYGVDDHAALHFVGTELREVVGAHPNAAAYRVEPGSETPIPARALV